MIIFIANNLLKGNMSKVENEKSTKRNKEECLHTQIQIKTSTTNQLNYVFIV